jgi:hypothetical protein
MSVRGMHHSELKKLGGGWASEHDTPAEDDLAAPPAHYEPAENDIASPHHAGAGIVEQPASESEQYLDRSVDP